MDTKKSSAPAHPSSSEKLPRADDKIEAHYYASLERLEEKLAHELTDDPERQELRDHVLELRRPLGLQASPGPGCNLLDPF